MPSLVRGLLAVTMFGAVLLAQDNPAELERRVGELVEQLRFDDALPLLDRWLAADAKSTKALGLRALVKNRRNDHDGAIADATRLIELDPKDPRGPGERAFAHHRKGVLPLARADYDRAVQLDPNAANLQCGRGDVLREQQEYVAAVAAYDKALAIRSDSVQALSGRAIAANALADFPAARADVVRAIELGAGDVTLWRLRAGTEFDCRADADALASAAEFVRRVPPEQRGDALALRGRLAWRLGNVAAAVQDLEASVEAATQDPTKVDALLSLANVHLGAGKPAEARAALTRTNKLKAPAMGFWIMLTSWCIDSRQKGVGPPEKGSLVSVGGRTLGPLERSLGELWQHGPGNDPNALGSPDDPFNACPRLFVAAWRADCSGNKQEAEQLFLRCINTGAKEWLQWATAVAYVRSQPSGALRKPDLGAELEFVDRDGATVAIVRKVTPLGAAECQGLRVGDQLIDLAGRPLARERWREIDARAREGLDLRVTRRRDGKDTVVILRLGLDPAPAASLAR